MFLPLRRYADFDGRSRRKEFWLWQLFNFIVGAVMTGILIAMVVPAIMRVDDRGGITPNHSSYSYSESYGGFSSGYSWEGNINLEMLMQEVGTGTWVMIGLLSLWSLIIFIPGLAVIIRRLHDTDRSGWWILIGIIPLIGMIVLRRRPDNVIDRNKLTGIGCSGAFAALETPGVPLWRNW